MQAGLAVLEDRRLDQAELDTGDRDHLGLRRAAGRGVRRRGLLGRHRHRHRHRDRRQTAGRSSGMSTAGVTRADRLRLAARGGAGGAGSGARPSPARRPAGAVRRPGRRRRRGGPAGRWRRRTGGRLELLEGGADAAELVVTGPLEGDPGAGEVLDPAVGAEGHVPHRPVGPAAVEEGVEGDVEALHRRRRRRAGGHGDVGPGPAGGRASTAGGAGRGGAAGGAGAGGGGGVLLLELSGASRPRAASAPRR